jgi:hypothetical protein
MPERVRRFLGVDATRWLFKDTMLHLPNLYRSHFSEDEQVKTICRRGHRRSYPGATVTRNRNKGHDGCRYCSHTELLAGFNDLATVRPDVARQLHPTLNGNITAAMMFPTSHDKLIWLCEKGHVFPSTVSNRTAANSTCPVCLFRLIQRGINDLKTTHPEIAAEWNYAKNFNHDIYSIAPGSNAVLWWICPKEHTFRQTIGGRKRGKGCNHCPRIEKRRSTIAVARPDLIPGFDRAANYPWTPEDLTIGSHRTMVWNCKNHHSFQQTVERRVAGYGCQICQRRQHIAGVNDIVTLLPRLASEWHPLKNAFLEVTDMFSRSRKVWWKCLAKGHETQQSVQHRIASGGCTDCPESARVEKPLRY